MLTKVATTIAETVGPPNVKVETLSVRWKLYFIIWIVSVFCSVSGYLIYYFVYQSCSPVFVITSPCGSAEVYSGYNQNGNHLCSTVYKTYNITGLPYQPCLLVGMSCSSYYQYNPDACSAAHIPTPDCSSMETHPCCGDNPTETIIVGYLQCTDTATAIVNAIQYTMYGQLFVFAMFFAVYRISTDGWSVTKTREFWISLFIHEEAKKETEAVEVKRTSADAGIECQTPMHPAL